MTDPVARVTYRRDLYGRGRYHIGREAEGADVGREVGNPQHFREVPEVLEEPVPIGPAEEAAALVGREAAGQDVLQLTTRVEGRDNAVPSAGKGTGTADDLPEDGSQVEATVDARDSVVQPEDATRHRLVLRAQRIGARQEDQLPPAGSGRAALPCVPARILGVGGLRVLDGGLSLGGLVAFLTLRASWPRLTGSWELGASLQTVRGGADVYDDVMSDPASTTPPSRRTGATSVAASASAYGGPRDGDRGRPRRLPPTLRLHLPPGRPTG